MIDAFQIETDGITVWVNGGKFGACLGRFGRMGIDVHVDPGAKFTDAKDCLFCTHAQVNRDDWDIFVAKMKEHHGIDVPDKYLPFRFRVHKKRA